MNQFQFIILMCTGLLAIFGVTAMVIGAFVKKNSNEIKAPCASQFTGIDVKVEKLNTDAHNRSDRVLILERQYTEIVSRLTRLESTIDKNAEQTAWIYRYMTEQDKKHKK